MKIGLSWLIPRKNDKYMKMVNGCGIVGYFELVLLFSVPSGSLLE